MKGDKLAVPSLSLPPNLEFVVHLKYDIHAKRGETYRDPPKSHTWESWDILLSAFQIALYAVRSYCVPAPRHGCRDCGDNVLNRLRI